MQAKVEIITVGFAKQLLEQNAANRPLSDATVRRYAADMKAGLWNNNGQGIVLTPEGQLLDGQHRMAAVVLAQREVGMLVVRGVPAGAFVTMDSGKPRSLPDVLAIEGYRHTVVLSSIARGAYAYVGGVAIRYNATKPTLEAFVRKHEYMQEVASKLGNVRLQFPKSPLGVVLFLGNVRRNLDNELEEFIDGLHSGAGLFKGDARLTLREWFIAQRERERGVLGFETAFAAYGRAWNAYAAGKEISVLKGLAAPNIRSMPIFGFDRRDFADVPDLYERAAEVRRSNLGAGATAPLELSAA